MLDVARHFFSVEEVKRIIDNISLAKAAHLDIAVLAATSKTIHFKQGIHVWIRHIDHENANLMILLSYIILGHSDWKKGKIKIFEITQSENIEESREKLTEIIQSGRLPISPKNIEILVLEETRNFKSLITEHSKEAGLTMIGFLEEQLKFDGDIFSGYDDLGDVLFINASELREIG